MGQPLRSAVFCLLTGVLLAVPVEASAAAPAVDLISRTATALGNDRSFAPEFSSDGRFVVFGSAATNLVPGDTNGQADVFVKDRRTGTISRVNTAAGGAQANRFAESATISGDGRYVAFDSPATNLVPGDTNNTFDVFVKDLHTGAVVRANTTASGGQTDDAQYPRLSGNGRHVTFSSPAANLVPGDTNGAVDGFVKNLDTGAVKRITTRSNGSQVAQPGALDFRPSADARVAAFHSSASYLVPGDTNGVSDVFVKNLDTGAVIRVTGSAGQFDGGAYRPSISTDGRYVAFDSTATNAAPGDANGESDVFRKDLATGAVVRVTDGNAASAGAAISAGGRHIAFESAASNLVAGDTGGFADVFVEDVATGVVTALSVPGDGESYSAAISANGRVAGFESGAANLVPGDDNATFDVFVHAFPGADADPYADAIGPGTNAVVLNGSTALGAPDGQLATVVGLLGGRIVLDLGAGEEGIGNLVIHYGGLNVGVATTVDLLDANSAVVGSAPVRLVQLGVGTHTAVVPHAGAPYRYVRVNAGVLQTIDLDAVQASWSLG